jgi:hypothetical protein
MCVATLQFATYDKLPPEFSATVHTTFYGVHASYHIQSAFVFLMDPRINLAYFWDRTICTFAQLIRLLGR